MVCHTFRRLFCRVYIVAVLAILALGLASRSLCSQSFDATNLRSPIDPQVPWLLHAGDNPDYARPDFDDSRWTRFDPTTPLKNLFPNDHPEIVWYRLHIKVAPDEAGLALSEWNIASAFEIYLNGEKIIQNGQVVPFVPYTFDGRLLKRIPDAQIATGSLVVAMRVHISPADWTGPFPGYFYTNFTLGQEEALSDHLWMHVIGENALSWFYQLVGVGLGIVALALFAAQPRQREYLWIFLMALALALQMPLSFYRLFHNLPAVWVYLSLPLLIAAIIFETLMYFALLRIPFGRWIRIFLAVVTVGILFSMVASVKDVGTGWDTLWMRMPAIVLVAGVIPILLIVH